MKDRPGLLLETKNGLVEPVFRLSIPVVLTLKVNIVSF